MVIIQLATIGWLTVCTDNRWQPRARFKGKRNEGRPRLRWIDNMNEDIALLGLTLRVAMDLRNNQDDNEHHLLIPIAAKWLSSGTDDDDE